MLNGHMTLTGLALSLVLLAVVDAVVLVDAIISSKGFSFKCKTRVRKKRGNQLTF